MGNDVAWTRREALGTSAFWLIVITFGVSHVGVTGLNLHVFSFVSDQGHPAMVAAYGYEHHRSHAVQHADGLGPAPPSGSNIPRLIMAKFLVQAVGISVGAIGPRAGFPLRWLFLYGIGMGGTAILAEFDLGQLFRPHLAWKNPRHGLADHQRLLRRRPALLRPDVRHTTQSYNLSFSIFIGMLFASAA